MPVAPAATLASPTGRELARDSTIHRPTRRSLTRACWKCGEAMVSSGVEIRGGNHRRGALRLKDFLGSVELLEEDSGCPWNERTCELAAKGGHLARCGGRGSTAASGTGRRVRNRYERAQGVAVGAGARLPVGRDPTPPEGGASGTGSNSTGAPRQRVGRVKLR